MLFAKARIVNSQEDVDIINAINEFHWINEALENYDVDDLEGQLVPLYEEDGCVITKQASDLFENRKVLSVSEESLSQFCDCCLYTDQASVPTFSFEGEEGFVWFPLSDKLYDDGLI